MLGETLGETEGAGTEGDVDGALTMLRRDDEEDSAAGRRRTVAEVEKNVDAAFLGIMCAAAEVRQSVSCAFDANDEYGNRAVSPLLTDQFSAKAAPVVCVSPDNCPSAYAEFAFDETTQALSLTFEADALTLAAAYNIELEYNAPGAAESEEFTVAAALALRAGPLDFASSTFACATAVTIGRKFKCEAAWFDQDRNAVEPGDEVLRQLSLGFTYGGEPTNLKVKLESATTVSVSTGSLKGAWAADKVLAIQEWLLAQRQKVMGKANLNRVLLLEALLVQWAALPATGRG